MRRHRSLLAAILAATLALAVLAGCGSDDDSGESSDTTVESGPKLTGDPVTIGIIYANDETSEQTEAGEAVKAAAKAQEARGGINGRPIEVKVCIAKSSDNNEASACANDLVNDPSVVALVGNFSGVGDAINQVLEKAGMATIGNTPLTGTDLRSPISFPVGSGAFAAPGAATVLVDKAGVKKVSAAIANVPSAAQLPPLVNQALGPRGASLEAVKIQLDKQDLSAEVAQVANTGDGIGLFVTSEAAARLIRAADSSGVWKGKPISSFTSQISADTVASLGSVLDGMYLATGGYATIDVKKPGVKRYLDELEKYSKLEGADRDSDLAKSAWIGFQVFAEATKGLTTIDRTTVLAAMSTVKYDPEGIAPPLDFTKPNTTLFAGAVPRVFNQKVMYARITKGKIVALDGTFVDPFAKP